jgi:hypothetical protein
MARTSEEIREYHRKYRETHREQVREYQRKYAAAHPDCIRASNRNCYEAHTERYLKRSQRWYAENTKVMATVSRKSMLKRQYGLTLEDYETMLVTQGGVCKMCGGPPGKRMLAVDHDHETGKIRGLLCVRCNVGLGFYERRKLQIEDYLKEG